MNATARRVFAALVIALPFVAASVTPAAAGASGYSPLNRPGPALDVPASLLAKSLQCSPNLRTSSHEPILLVPGTTVTPAVEYSWTYERAFNQLNLPWCAVTLPASAMSDIQTAGEYVVHAIRTMHADTHKLVQIVGHSQGGMVPRWALRFWPDTRAMVDDMIGMAPSNHGTVDAFALCPPIAGCAPALWQQEFDSPFIEALNSGAETFAGISYTDIYSIEDEIVVPNLSDAGSSSLHTGAGAITNVSVQSVCPGHVTDHLLIGTVDPVAYALVMDALNHPGPADPSRIGKSVCGEQLQPGVDPTSFVANLAKASAYLATTLATSPHVAAAPPLAGYTRG
ncbi:MAG TPA: lipase [Mycobacteriales bacterium]|nr:lipase [Mycobacteriales bacterium]